jgi:hypothetical protein
MCQLATPIFSNMGSPTNLVMYHGGTLIKRLIDWGRVMTTHTLMCLACEHMVIGVRQLQRENWVGQPMNELCTVQGQDNP